GNDPYPWPMVSTYPLPKYYILDVPKTLRTKQESEISAFLASSKETERDASWMDDCRRQFCKIMATKSNTLTGYVLADLLERVVLHLSSSSTDCFFPPAEYKVVGGPQCKDSKPVICGAVRCGDIPQVICHIQAKL
ncbi:hypothetical protein cypCar_00029380, partial [Cyprinus carpio]